MIALGFGSNLGDRIHYLSRAFRELIDRRLIRSPIRVSSLYESPAMTPPGAPSAWNLDFLNFVMVAETSLSPQNLLKEVKAIEAFLGRQQKERWAPREIDIDILWWDNRQLNTSDLQLPHPEFRKRDFVMLPLQELFIEDARFQIDNMASKCKKLPQKILPAEIVGIVNLTPDSFSDGGKFDDLDAAIERIEQLENEGAHIIDIGAESTRPGAKALTPEEEWLRLEPVLKCIPKSVRWSLDSRHAANMTKALEYGVTQLNDVSGLQGLDNLKVIRNSQRPVVVMHNLGIPASKKVHLENGVDPVREIENYFHEKLQQLDSEGIDLRRIILDPGIGFGKTAHQSAEILSRINELKIRPDIGLYIGHSRKSFMNLISSADFESRDLETAVVSANLIKQPVNYLRVHDVTQNKRAILSELLIGFGAQA